jgi:hypothetical protein
MEKLKNKACKKLTSRAKDIKSLQRPKNMPPQERPYEFEAFFRSWLKKIIKTSETNYAEKMIYLWVTINAWASIVVPDKTINHLDSYLIHAMAKNSVFNVRFNELMENNNEFSSNAKELLSLAPVFQVLWLRNKEIHLWDSTTMDRLDYAKLVFKQYPYSIKKEGDEPIAHFSPRCAETHILSGEDIPNDWPHTLHSIYQIRCNLFHGGKNYANDRDRRFIELAYLILWEMFEPEFRELNLIETAKEVGLSWDRLFVRSGFCFEMLNGACDFSCESPHNIKYLFEILSSLGLADQFSSENNLFSPNANTFSQEKWLNAIEGLHGGAEGGPSDMEQIELKIMDTYMAGIVRWLNYIGLSTTYSCDGHNTQTPVIAFVQSDGSIIFENILNIICPSMKLVRRSRDSNTVSLSDRRANNHRDFDRSRLPALAEELYRNKDDLKILVNVMSRINIQRGN